MMMMVDHQLICLKVHSHHINFNTDNVSVHLFIKLYLFLQELVILLSDGI